MIAGRVTIATEKFPPPPTRKTPRAKRRGILARILWDHFVHSAPTGGKGPCLTVDQAAAAGLVPPGAAVVGSGSACICVDRTASHPVVCVKVTPCPPGQQPPTCALPDKDGRYPTAYDLDGNALYGEVDELWSLEDLMNELAAAIVSGIMDCFEHLDADGQAAVLEQVNLDSGDALADKLKTCACDALNQIFAEKCIDPLEGDHACIQLVLGFAEWCDIPLLEAMADAYEDCTVPDDEPPPEPPPPAPPEEPPVTQDDGSVLYHYLIVRTTEDVWPGHTEAWPPHIPLPPKHLILGDEYTNIPYTIWHPASQDAALFGVM